MLHEAPAKAAAFEIGADQDRVFGACVVGIGEHADHAEQGIRAFADGHEGHLARVVDLGQPGEKRVRQVGSCTEEAQSAVIRRHGGEEFCIERLVLRADRSNARRHQWPKDRSRSPILKGRAVIANGWRG